MNRSTDYHDYVFRDGKVLGEFEEMYRNSTVTPWHQDEQQGWIDVRLTIEMLRDFGRFQSIHDFGCGTGHCLDLMMKNFLAPDGKGYGYDISATSCAKAASLFPCNDFSVLDLTQKTVEKNKEKNKEKLAQLFMIRATLWYVLPKLDVVIENIANLMQYPDRLLVVQNFPPLCKSFIGKDVLPDHFALIERFATHFVLERHMWYEDRLKVANDNWFVGLFSIKEKN